MVIQCSACQTRYRLADEKIRPQGTKVRCSKCGEVFTVLPGEPGHAQPSPEPSPDAISSSAAEPAAGWKIAATTPPRSDEYLDWSDLGTSDRGSTPTPAAGGEDSEGNQVLQGPADGAFFGEFPLDETQASTPGGDEFAFEPPAPAAETDEFVFGEISDEEEEEITFEEEFPGEDDIAFGGGKTVGPAEEGLSPLEFDNPVFGESSSRGDSPNEDLDVGLGAGTNDELTFEERDEPAVAPAFPETEDDTFSWGEPGEAAVFADEFDFGGGDEDLAEEETEDLDFELPGFAEEPPPLAPPVQETAPSVAPGKPSKPEKSATPAATPIIPTDRRKYARRKRRGGTSLLTWLVAVILLGLCAAMGYFYWQGEFPDIYALLNRFMPPATTNQAASKIQVTKANGFFVNNREAGQLFVVQGEAVNGYTEPRSAMAVQGKLFNQAGNLLRERTAYCGNSFSASELKSLPLAKLHERSDNQFGDSLSNLNVAAGKSVPFTLVFSNLPSDLAEFTVEPGDSIPGSKQ